MAHEQRPVFIVDDILRGYLMRCESKSVTVARLDGILNRVAKGTVVAG